MFNGYLNHRALKSLFYTSFGSYIGVTLPVIDIGVTLPVIDIGVTLSVIDIGVTLSCH